MSNKLSKNCPDRIQIEFLDKFLEVFPNTLLPKSTKYLVKKNPKYFSQQTTEKLTLR